ncbi:hypothetical protein XENOCAPTIV_024894 [Xenoophorus captivus]|uniref:Uncharacterized protein n=1 Tax=Xenoophorus captivus TaxID=1517983 RepID=A0ABV0RUM1_9TELE
MGCKGRSKTAKRLYFVAILLCVFANGLTADEDQRRDDGSELKSYHDPDSEEEDVHIVSRILAAASVTPHLEEEKLSLRETEEKEELPEQPPPPPPPPEEKPKEGEQNLLYFSTMKQRK